MCSMVFIIVITRITMYSVSFGQVLKVMLTLTVILFVHEKYFLSLRLTTDSVIHVYISQGCYLDE